MHGGNACFQKTISMKEYRCNTQTQEWCSLLPASINNASWHLFRSDGIRCAKLMLFTVAGG